MKSDKQTYILIKDGVAMAFEGPREPVREPIEPRILPEDVWCINVYMPWKKEMELAKASALPLIYETNVEWGKDGIFFFEGNKIKEGEVVPLEGWELKVVRQQPCIKANKCLELRQGLNCSQVNKAAGCIKEQMAYRLVRSEPMKDDNRGDLMGTQPFINDPDYPELLKESPIEAKTQESQEELYEEVVNVIWNLGDNTSFKDCKNYLKENYTITRNQKKP